MNGSLDFIAHYLPAIAAAVIAYITLRLNMRQKAFQREKQIALLESKVTDLAENMKTIQGNFGDVRTKFSETHEKVLNTEQNVNRLIDRVDNLIEQIMEWKRDGK